MRGIVERFPKSEAQQPDLDSRAVLIPHEANSHGDGSACFARFFAFEEPTRLIRRSMVGPTYLREIDDNEGGD